MQLMTNYENHCQETLNMADRNKSSVISFKEQKYIFINRT